MYGPLGFKQPPPRWLGGFSQPGPLGGGTIQGGGAPGPTYGGGFAKPPGMPGASVGQPVNRYLGGFGRPGPLPGLANGGVTKGPAIVGERGPELLFPGNRSATVVPLQGGASALGPGRDSRGNLPPNWAPGSVGGGRPVGSPNRPDEMKGVFVGPYQRMPGAFYEPNPNKGWGQPSQVRVTGAANIAAKLGLISQEKADEMKAWALQQLGENYDSLSPMDKEIYDQYRSQMASQGYYDPMQTGIYNDWFEMTQGMFDPNAPPAPKDYLNITQDEAEAATRYQDDRTTAYYRKWMEPGYTTPPYASGQLGQELSPAQRRADWEAYRAWYMKTFGVDPDPIYDDSMGAT